MKNNKGFTLLEAMAAVIIVSIVICALMQLMTSNIKMAAKFTKKLETTKVTYFATSTENSTRTPILCLSNKSSNDFALVCKAATPCVFTAGKWVRDNKDECDGGVLFK
mgnify:CR=1 FL=1